MLAPVCTCQIYFHLSFFTRNVHLGCFKFLPNFVKAYQSSKGPLSCLQAQQIFVKGQHTTLVTSVTDINLFLLFISYNIKVHHFILDKVFGFWIYLVKSKFCVFFGRDKQILFCSAPCTWNAVPQRLLKKWQRGDFITGFPTFLNPFTPKSAKNQNSDKSPILFCENLGMLIVPRESTADEVSFE